PFAGGVRKPVTLSSCGDAPANSAPGALTQRSDIHDAPVGRPVEPSQSPRVPPPYSYEFRNAHTPRWPAAGGLVYLNHRRGRGAMDSSTIRGRRGRDGRVALTD